MTTPTQNEAAGLTDSLQTYELFEGFDYAEMIPANNGEFVLLSDVKAILSAQANDAKAQEDANEYQTKFVLQRKSCLPHWEDETPGHSKLEDSLACVKFCKSTNDRPLRIIEIKRRTAMDQDAINAAIQGMQTGSGE
jgi:hypothetical protein